ncbi:hypothetical protein FRB95_009611 [Tulasnella sp. JGI-2019a]|nr:hypothetical protein FRB95_009611 [Tulasnella sp. JGI-2019a]
MLTVIKARQCHRALLLDEVLVQVFQYLSRDTLTKAAVVCRAWNEPVLKILWEKVYLENFLKLFGGLRLENDYLRSDNACTEKNLDRLILYGSCIKSGYLYYRLHDTFLDELNTTIAQLSQPLFPLLHDLTIGFFSSIPQDSDGSHAFAGPVLQQSRPALHFKKATTAFCMQLPILSPFLEELVLSIDIVAELSTFTVAEMLARLPALRHVDIQAGASFYDTGTILSVLAGHRSLDSLQIRDMDLVPPHSALAHRGGFASLRQITSVRCPGIELFLKSLSPLSEPTYVRIANTDFSSRAIAEFFQVVGTFKRLESLGLQGYGVDLEVPLTGALGPLGLCSMLETLSIVLVPRIPMRDDDLGAVLSHLPRLINFRLGDSEREGREGRPDITLRALAIIVASCPMIQSIRIYLDA